MNDKPKSIHYISWMFGIVFACGLVSLITIIPQHNILKEPYYWYEAMIEGGLSVPILSTLIIFNGTYWANISYFKNWTTFFILIVIAEYFPRWRFHLLHVNFIANDAYH